MTINKVNKGTVKCNITAEENVCERCLIRGNICKVELFKTAQTHPSLNVPSFRIIGLNLLCVCHIDL